MERFDIPVDRRGTGSIKWDRAKGKFSTDKELIPLWIADTDFKAPPEAMEAVAGRAVDRGIGARGLRAILEEVMNKIMYDVPSDPTIAKVTITAPCVTEGAQPEIIRDPERQARLPRGRSGAECPAPTWAEARNQFETEQPRGPSKRRAGAVFSNLSGGGEGLPLAVCVQIPERK